MLTQISNTKNKENLSPAAQYNRSSRNNHRASGVLNNLKIQAKLTVGQPNDKYEQEADRVADQVMRMSDGDVAQRLETGHIQPMQIQRMCAGCEEETAQRQPIEEEEEEELQAKTSGGKPLAETASIESGINGKKGSGRLLPLDTRSFMESRFGADFGGVKIHTDSNAVQMSKELNAQAFTVSNNIFFNSGRYDPSSLNGKQLLAHELTHVVQQSSRKIQQSRLVVRSSRDQCERKANQDTSQIANGSVTNPGTSIVHAMVNEGIQRYEFGEGAGPDFGGGDRLVPVPNGHRERVEAALNIVSRVVSNPRDFPACPRFFKDNCPGGSATALYDAFNRAVIWFNEGAPPRRGGVTAGLGGENIGYTGLTYRIGHWAMAASFIHEFMHVCGQANHDIGDQAKDVCGRLPDIIRITPRIEISNPI